MFHNLGMLLLALFACIGTSAPGVNMHPETLQEVLETQLESSVSVDVRQEASDAEVGGAGNVYRIKVEDHEETARIIMVSPYSFPSYNGRISELLGRNFQNSFEEIPEQVSCSLQLKENRPGTEQYDLNFQVMADRTNLIVNSTYFVTTPALEICQGLCPGKAFIVHKWVGILKDISKGIEVILQRHGSDFAYTKIDSDEMYKHEFSLTPIQKTGDKNPERLVPVVADLALSMWHCFGCIEVMERLYHV